MRAGPKEIDIVDLFEGTLVVADVPGLDPRFKPCYVRARGGYNGSYTRIGDGDRRLTDFEIHLLHTNRGQPERPTDSGSCWPARVGGLSPAVLSPALSITFVVYPGLLAGDQIEGGPRFLDNRAFDGPISVMGRGCRGCGDPQHGSPIVHRGRRATGCLRLPGRGGPRGDRQRPRSPGLRH